MPFSSRLHHQTQVRCWEDKLPATIETVPIVQNALQQVSLKLAPQLYTSALLVPRATRFCFCCLIIKLFRTDSESTNDLHLYYYSD